jgi:hypothetical protein
LHPRIARAAGSRIDKDQWTLDHDAYYGRLSKKRRESREKRPKPNVRVEYHCGS